MINSADTDQLAFQKPTDLDLHCFLRQGISGFSRTRIKFFNRMSSKSTALDKGSIYINILISPQNGEALLMSTHNICFCGEIRKHQHFFVKKTKTIKMSHLEIRVYCIGNLYMCNLPKKVNFFYPFTSYCTDVQEILKILYFLPHQYKPCHAKMNLRGKCKTQKVQIRSAYVFNYVP